MSVDAWVEFFIWWGAVASTSFVILYPLLSPGWRRTLIGWGLLVSSSALAMLLDLTLATKVLGPDFFLRYPEFRIAVVALVAVGATLKLTALLVGKFNDWCQSR